MKAYQFIKQLRTIVLVVVLGAGLTACSVGTMAPSEQLAKDRLEQAKSSYALAKSNPNVEVYSMKYLLPAEKALQEAELAWKKANESNPMDPSRGYSQAELDAFYDNVARMAYQSKSKSQIAISFAEGVVAASDKLKLGQELAEAQLQKSNIEKKNLQKDMDAKNSALERSRQELNLATSEAERARILADIQAKEILLAKAQADAKAREAAQLAEANAQEAEQARVLAAAKAKEAEQAIQLASAKAKEAEEARLLAAASAKDAERSKAELAQLMKELSELQGQMTERGIVLTIGDVLFATGKSSLNESAQVSMNKIAEFMQKNANRNLLVEGHTDSVGSDESNLKLSEERAASVKVALEKLGVAPARIVTIGYGKKFPVAANDTAAGKQKNRRVEVIILNEGVKPESQFRK